MGGLRRGPRRAAGLIWVNTQCVQSTDNNGASATWGEATMTNNSWSNGCSGDGVCVWTSASYCVQQ